MKIFKDFSSRNPNPFLYVDPDHDYYLISDNVGAETTFGGNLYFQVFQFCSYLSWRWLKTPKDNFVFADLSEGEMKEAVLFIKDQGDGDKAAQARYVAERMDGSTVLFPGRAGYSEALDTLLEKIAMGPVRCVVSTDSHFCALDIRDGRLRKYDPNLGIVTQLMNLDGGRSQIESFLSYYSCVIYES